MDNPELVTSEATLEDNQVNSVLEEDVAGATSISQATSSEDLNNKKQESIVKDKRKRILNNDDSDSESELPLPERNEEIDDQQIGKKSSRIIDSDSEDENQGKTTKKPSKLLDSDSSDDESEGDRGKANKSSKIVDSESSDSDSDKGNAKKINNKLVDSDSDSNKESKKKVDSESESDTDFQKSKRDVDSEEELNKSEERKTQKSNKFSTLIDSESEGEESASVPTKPHNAFFSDDDEGTTNTREKSDHEQESKKPTKKRKGAARASKTDALTEIKSETQRLVRERGLSLPYHRPKQRTLQEFLNRKKMSSILPTGTTTANKLKTCSEIIRKALEEKEKEAETFYKSSDSEDEPESKPMENSALIVSKDEIFESVEEIGSMDTQQVDFAIETTPIDLPEENATQEEFLVKSPTKDLLEEEPVESVVKAQETDGKQTDSLTDSCKRDFVLKLSDDESDSLEQGQQHNENNSPEIKVNLPKIKPRIIEEKVLEGSEKLPRLSVPDFVSKPMSSARQKILSNISNVKPHLQGSSGMVIDFSSMDSRKDGLRSLKSRFLKHFIDNNKPDKPVKMENPQSLGVDNDDPALQKPGAKLLKLQEQLKLKMTSKRNAEWKLKEEQEFNETKCSEDEEEDYCEISDDELENEEEISECEESEEEEDMIFTEKKRKRCEYADDEAEVSDDGDLLSEDESELNELDKIKPPIDEISNQSAKLMKRNGTDSDMFELASSTNSLSGEESQLPPCHQTNTEGNSQIICKTPSLQESAFSFMTPLTMDSSQKKEQSDRANTPVDNLLLSDSSFDKQKRANLQKKLFDEPIGTVNDDELAGLCSGTFDATQLTSQRCILPGLIDNNAESLKSSTDSQLMAVCSGGFGTTQLGGGMLQGLIDPANSLESTESQLLELCSGDFSSKVPATASLADTLPALGTLNENSLDFKLTLDDESRDVTTDLPTESKLLSLSSDEEETPSIKTKQKRKVLRKKKRAKQLNFSDDENSDLSDFSQQEDSEGEEEVYVDYDSEENEVVVPKKDIRKVMANFVENEAELSESDWGSADEDEKDLDKLELEECDEEEIDEGELKDQLDKLHMKRLMDEDQRDVRMLKELLFEDGDLHTDGSGRQRQFKWKNIDDLGENTPRPDDDALIDFMDDDDASELEWRKLKHERDLFLAKEATDNDQLEEEDSQILKLGMRALKKIKKTVQTTSVLPEEKQQKAQQHTIDDLLENPTKHRGSFLARSESVLARFAAMSKKGGPTTVVKTSRNFVFQMLDLSEKDDDDRPTENVQVQNPSRDFDSNKMRKRKPTTSLTPSRLKKVKNNSTKE